MIFDDGLWTLVNARSIYIYSDFVLYHGNSLFLPKCLDRSLIQQWGGSWCHWMWLSAKANTRHQPCMIYVGCTCQLTNCTSGIRNHMPIRPCCPKYEPSSDSTYTQIFFPINSRMNLAWPFYYCHGENNLLGTLQFRQKRTRTSMAWWTLLETGPSVQHKSNSCHITRY